MTKTIFDSCQPRPDVLAGTVAEADFAADLAQVLAGKGDYADPTQFFARSWPTRGLRNLLANVCRRLSGTGGEAAAIFRLDTAYGGGKTHGLIALCHAARSGADSPGIAEFVDPALLPQGPVRIAAFDGENADPANGREMEAGHRAFTPWGEIASTLAGAEGYERVRQSDERGIAPGAETLRELFGGEPTLILLDELSIYLRKVDNRSSQLTAFLNALFKAVESAPNAALVYTLAIGKTDAFSEENQSIADAMAELESVSARKATLLNPTEEDETVQILRRRLFEFIDQEAAATVAEDYRKLWSAHPGSLAEVANRPETVEAFRASYPLHPEVLETLTAKTATLGDFQRVRGMLRLLARTVAQLWAERPGDAAAIHLHHIDPGHEPIKQEFTTKLKQEAFLPAISHDISGPTALAWRIDARRPSEPPRAQYVARTIFLHSLAFNEALKGITPERLRYSLLGPRLDIELLEEARKQFLTDSAYLDDRPGPLMRFLAEANLSQVIRRTEEQVDMEEVRVRLNDWIQSIFKDGLFEAIVFPIGGGEVPDEIGNGRPKLVVLGYDAETVGGGEFPSTGLMERTFTRTGAHEQALRKLRNNLVFVVAEETRKGVMRERVRRRMALEEMKREERLKPLAKHQQEEVKRLAMEAEKDAALAIQQCYRHIFHPSHAQGGAVDLAHKAIEDPAASDRPGQGQKHIVRALQEIGKLRPPEGDPDSPAYVRDRTPLRNGQMSTRSLRDEFRRAPALPMLVGDDVFLRGVREGIQKEVWVYQSGDLLCGPGDPQTAIRIDEQSFLLTMDYAREKGIWPRDVPPPPPPPPPPPVPDDPGPFTAEDVLRAALVSVWEQARARNVEAIGSLQVRLFGSRDAFRLISPVGAVSEASRRFVEIEAGFQTRHGSQFSFGFKGPVQEADLVRGFLEPNMRVAVESNLDADFVLTFEDGLSLRGDAPEKLTDRLTKYVNGAAHVTATTQGKA